MELRIAIVEDQKFEAQRLERLLRQTWEDPVVCDLYESGDAFLHRAAAGPYAVVFLDICMEGTNGIGTARQLREKDPHLLIVFVTSSPEYVWEAFPVHPFDYLLKPYKEEKIRQLTAELRRVLCRQEPELEVRIARQTVQLPLNKILYAESQNHFVRIVTDDGECRAAATFAQVEQQLETQENFLVCNRGLLLNMDKVLRFEGDCIEMLGGALTALCLGCAALCTIFELPSNVFLLPILIVSFWLLRWRTEGVTVSQTAFLFSVSAVMLAVCSLMAVVLNARAETGNQQEANLVSTALLALCLSAVLSVLFHFTAVRWSAWLLQEYHGEAFWQSAWPLPAIYAAFLIFCIPLDPSVVLLNRIMIIAVLAVSISLLGIFLLLYEMYRVAQEYTRNTQLDRENQLLGVESRRYMELREYMEQTRSLRHDFRQHLHVISGLTEAGQLDELKHYLSQYESELSEARPTLCANPAVDALAGHYDHEARQKGVPIEWKLELPVLLPMPEADLCMILGNLLENALDASRKLTPDQRQIRVMARMLSPAMLGIVVENRYDGVLKKQSGILHSTKHEGIGIGLVSIETAVRKYNGDLTVETKNNVFRANVLLNL